MERKSEISILGVGWHTDRDTLKINNVIHNEFGSLTKRQALAYVSEQYDPIGLISPIGIRGRMLMRKLWQTKTG